MGKAFAKQLLFFLDYIQAGTISGGLYEKCKENRKKREGMDSVRCTFTQHMKYYWLVKVSIFLKNYVHLSGIC